MNTCKQRYLHKLTKVRVLAVCVLSITLLLWRFSLESNTSGVSESGIMSKGGQAVLYESLSGIKTEIEITQGALAGYQPPPDQKPPSGRTDSSGVR